MHYPSSITQVIGSFPYRMALAGGWIDQPFISKHNPSPPGSMVVVGLEPTCWFMERSGMATGTRKVAMKIWGGNMPEGNPYSLVKELYTAENHAKPEPSGSQDMIGLIFPGINRLDYDFNHEGGYFPIQINSCCDQAICLWLEQVLYFLPIAPRPLGYNPLGEKNLDPSWIQRLSQSGKECYAAILEKDHQDLGQSFNECMRCWQTILPHTVHHPTIHTDLMGLLAHYQRRYAGAMYSGCGGGYLIVVADEPVPGAFQVKIRKQN